MRRVPQDVRFHEKYHVRMYVATWQPVQTGPMAKSTTIAYDDIYVLKTSIVQNTHCP